MIALMINLLQELMAEHTLSMVNEFARKHNGSKAIWPLLHRLNFQMHLVDKNFTTDFSEVRFQRSDR